LFLNILLYHIGKSFTATEFPVDLNYWLQ
jgi:hypothetical protein